jgi:hypothetical protein
MRLNEKTYPAYSVLDSGNLDWLKIDQVFSDTLNDNRKFLDFISSLKITYSQVDVKYYISNPFKDSIRIAIPKIIKDSNYIDKISPGCGVLFTEAGFTLYLVNPTDKGVRLLVYGFTRDVLTTYGIITHDNQYGGIAAVIKDGKPYNDFSYLADFMNGILFSLYFIENCEIEQKIVKPKEKYRSGNDNHYNESKSDIIFLDCKWFTELIRLAPFHVKGHLRWQNYGEKFGKRKLIWIEEFEKKGYNRKPAKLV